MKLSNSIPDNDIYAYAQVLLSAICLQKGQNLYITGSIAHNPLMIALNECAYQSGARYVHTEITSQQIYSARVSYSDTQWLEYVPTTFTKLIDVLDEENWLYISICGTEFPELIQKLDQHKHLQLQCAREHARKKFLRSLMRNKFRWLVCSFPTEKWAEQVLTTGSRHDSNSISGGGNSAAISNRPLERIWDIMRPILRLNYPDPSKQWWHHITNLQHIATTLTKMNIRKLHFVAPDTDLWVPLHPNCNWKGGLARSLDDHKFICNLPTEEVYTTPDWRSVEGTIRLTRPAIIYGTAVHDVLFHFEKGEIVQVDTQEAQGKIAISRILEIDEGARRMGEIALVDCNSPLFQCGYTFNNILLDENAACHFALGKGYPGRIQDGAHKTDEELRQMGVNLSSIHIDMMFGSDSLNIYADTDEQTAIPIFRNGHFTDEIIGEQHE